MIVVVPVDPPREGLVLPSLVETTPLTAAEAASLYEAAVADVLYAVASSGGDLLVNYRDEETLPDEFAGAEFDDPETEVRELAAAALETTDDVRFERQVGSSHSARIGNTVTHLLEREEAGSVGVLEPTAPLVSRSEIDSAAMSLRRYDAILGPSTGGRAYVAGFTEPIDFADAYATPELSTLADRSQDAGLKLGFAPMVPDVRSESGLCATIAGLEARRAADRPGAAATAAVVDELGLVVGEDDSLERQ
ncbi:hypothetical protein [Halopiger xanaduensis]|uniref:DUF2064 domain-containing protein n=1 Tax=Halopiger xanaduensis (strain DSM 18323 / JCM 14033 / SH-6) TaxID=797210 RepID=F8D6N5_HALXS|nr:hypothetical protein [Halopiger xanaduensis]AEH37775.1 hypothetical protein Halxa_3162 [Halopiger xanaduensis SH-6]